MDVVELNILNSSRATDYEIFEVIGVGQNGVVVSARCTSRGLPRPQKLYAVKLLFNFTHEYSTLIRNAYENEWLVLSRLLPHPGIVRFWAQFVCIIPDNFVEVLPEDVREFANQKKRTGENSRRKGQFVVMDYHPRNATQWVNSLPHPIPLQPVVDFAVQVFEAVVYLEDHNICHLDLKLDNILVTDENKFVLCDFGCAEQFPSEDKRLWYQRGSLAGGNKAHLAPEVQTVFNKCKRNPHEKGILDYNAQASWAAAVLVYEVAIGSHPLPDYPLGYDNDGEIAYKLKDLHPLPKEFPTELTFLLQSMLHPNPVRRPMLDKALQQLKTITPSSRHTRLSGLSNELEEVKREKELALAKLKQVAAERDAAVKEVREMADQCKSIADEFETMAGQYEKILKEKDDIKQQLSAALEASEHAMEVHSMLNEKLDLVMRERDLARKQVQELKHRTFQGNQFDDLKECERCNRFYLGSESGENLCQWHPGKYLFKRWSCCYRQDEKADGCKFSYHIPRSD